LALQKGLLTLGKRKGGGAGEKTWLRGKGDFKQCPCAKGKKNLNTTTDT